MRLPRAAFAAVAVAVVIAFAAPRDSYKMLLRSIFRSLRQGDSTAQGVARARHIETIYPIEVGQKRLFEDPYAKHFYAGSAVTALLFDWVGPVMLFRLLGNVNAGIQPAMAGRTAEFDAQVQTAVEAGCKQARSTKKLRGKGAGVHNDFDNKGSKQAPFSTAVD